MHDSGICTTCAAEIRLTQQLRVISAHRDKSGQKCPGSGRHPRHSPPRGSHCGVCNAVILEDAAGGLLSHWVNGGRCPGGNAEPTIGTVKTGKRATSHNVTCSRCGRVEVHSGPWRPGITMGPHTSMTKVGPKGPQCPGAGRKPSTVAESTTTEAVATWTGVAILIVAVAAAGMFVLSKLPGATDGNDGDSGRSEDQGATSSRESTDDAAAAATAEASPPAAASQSRSPSMGQPPDGRLSSDQIEALSGSELTDYVITRAGVTQASINGTRLHLRLIGAIGDTASEEVIRSQAKIHVLDCVAFSDDPGEFQRSRDTFNRNGGASGEKYFQFLVSDFCPDVDLEEARRIFAS